MAIVYRSVAVGAGGGNVPNGQTILPINDVQLWMACANVKDSSYTTLEEVLEDTTLLAKLINSRNASDYLVRSIGFANDICASETAMQDINASDYCVNTLVGDESWLDAITNSVYMEIILNVKVPTMTSNTEPSGEVFTNSVQSGTDRLAYKAFDGNTDSSFWHSNNGMPVYIGYEFEEPVAVHKVTWKTLKSNGKGPKTSELQGSNDGTTWTKIGDFVNCPNLNTTYSKNYTSNVKYTQWRIYMTASNYQNYGCALEIQFYGRA